MWIFPSFIDLSQESQQTLDEYGVTRAEPEKQNFRGGGPNVYKQFATNCLLARRLVERGVRFITLMHASWDHHSNLDAELQYNAGMADQPIAALLKDLKQRGLLDSTLVIFAGEFGRTPLAVGDLIEADEGSGIWVVVDEPPEDDVVSPGMVAVSWRGDGDESGSLSVSDDLLIPVRRPEEDT